MCQDTGTAIVVGKRTETVLTGGNDEEAISRGVFEAYDELNLRYSQMAPTSFWDERNTGTNLPAQVELYSAPGDGRRRYELLVLAKGGGSANKTFLYQETKALLNPKRLAGVPRREAALAGHGGLPAVPPGDRRRRDVGGVHAQGRQAGLGALPRHAADLRAPRSGTRSATADLEQQVLELTREFGIGAQFGGKYFCHDVRVIRLPRHGASLPVGHRRVLLGRPAGQGEDHPGGRVPGAARARPGPVPARRHRDERPVATSVGAGRPEPADGRDPRPALHAAGEDPGVADRAAGGGPRHRAREDRRAAGRGRADARLPARPPRLLRGTGQDPGGLRVRLVRADHGRAGWTPTSSSSRRRAGRW